jgi:hypothetical protein
MEYHLDRTRSPIYRNVHFGLSFQTFSIVSTEEHVVTYERWMPSITFDMRRDLSKPVQHSFRLRAVLLSGRDEVKEGPGEGDVLRSDLDVFRELRYDLVRTQGLYPFSLNATLLDHDAFTRLSVEGKYAAIYDDHRHRISMRLFAGQFLRKDESLMSAAYGWRFHTGNFDLLYDHLIFERQPLGVLTDQQITKDLGGFKTPNSYGTSDTWIAALNMELDAPFLLPISFFGSVGASPVKINGQTETRFQYEGGIGLRILRDVAEVWVPLAVSEDINDQLEFYDIDFTERIRIVLALERLDPTRALRRAPF